MELENRTGLQARMLTAELPGEALVRAAVLVKATWDLHADGTLTPSPRYLPITPQPLATPYGTFHGELFPRKEGADLCVLGTLRRASPVTVTRVVVRVGARIGALRVTGDRVWCRDARGALAPSAPTPFTTMTLGYDRAFGGSALGEHGAVPWADNPEGRGYHLDAERAEAQPLPNIEPDGGPYITRWDDRPPVAGFGPYPMFWAARARDAVVFDGNTKRVTKLHPRLFNHAHPSWVLPRIAPGERVDIEGLTEAPLRFEVPRVLARVEVRVGGVCDVVRGVVDGVFVWADHGKVVVTQRALFKYARRRGEVRSARLSMLRADDGAGEVL